MPPTTHRADALRTAVVALLALVFLVSACSFRPPIYTCATDTLPPIAVDPIVCHNGLPAVRWFSAVEGSPLASPGLPLDYAWWHGGRGTIGYGPGYDPRPREVWTREVHYLPYREPVTQVPAEPPAARSVSTPTTAAKAGTRQQGDPPKAPAKATPPTTRKTTR